MGKKEIVLGLDLGPTSIGWALLEKVENKETGIIDAGVRIFPEGVDRDTKGAEKSKNKQRQEARSARRIKQRRRRRKELLQEICTKANLLPKNPKEFSDLLQQEPYQLRAKALDEKLTPYQLGRVLFHISQRRGFKSNRKAGKDADSGKIQKGITDLQENMDKAKARTLGEYLHGIQGEKKKVEDKSVERILLGEVRLRSRYTLRAMYEEEFSKIWDAQKKHHPKLLTDELHDKIFDAIFFQRPLKPKDHLIGKCDLEPEEPRCARAEWAAQQFRILKEINNLIIINRDGSELTLTDNQRETLIGELSVKKTMAFSSMKKKLELLETQTFNLEKGGRDKLLGNSVNASLSSVFGAKKWAKMEEKDKKRLRDWVVNVEDPDELSGFLADRYKLDEKEIDSLVHLDLPKGYANFSKKAFENIIPLLAKGKNEHDAITELYPDWKESKLEYNEFLPMPPNVRNPIVQRTLTEVRKVINALIRKYGRPDQIYVELARDMKGNQEQRKEASLEMWKRNQDNEKIRERLQKDFELAEPRMADIVKFKLWREQEGICPYSGRAIPMEKLFSPDIEVDHILPFSRSLDDSYLNKVACYAKANRDKGNKTPREWLEGNNNKWEKMQQQIAGFENMPRNKKRKFRQKEITITKDKMGKLEINTFIARQLNDTRYISTEVVKYLKSLFPIEEQKKHVPVRATRGQLTAELRKRWGLNAVLNPLSPELKNREDHRHHAVDAVVVALSTPSHMQALAKSYKYHLRFDALPQPWENFRGDVSTVINKINVSFRVQRKISGALHEETSYGHINGDRFVYRVPVTSLTGSKIMDIRDPVIKKLIIERCKEMDFDPEKNKSKVVPAKVFPDDDPLKMSSGVIIKKVRIETTIGKNRIGFKDKDGKVFRYSKLGSNHHIEIIKTKDTKGKVKIEGIVVSTLEATRRAKNKEPIIKRDHGTNIIFICSLSINECLMVKSNDDQHSLFRVQKMWSTTKSQTIQLRPHTYAGEASKNMKAPMLLFVSPSSLMKKEGFKVNISPIGEVSVAND